LKRRLLASLHIALVSGCAVLVSTLSAFADPAAAYYLDANFWKKIDWTLPQTSLLWRLPGWTIPVGDDAHIEGGTMLERRTISIDGTAFNAYWGSGNTGMFSSFTGEVSRAQCFKLADTFRARFGPSLINDGTMNTSFGGTTSVNLIAVDYQWDLGNTRVSSACFGSVTEDTNHHESDGPLIFLIEFGDVTTVPKLVPKFALRCTERIHVSNGSVEDQDQPDFEFWVDTRNKHVLNAFHNVLSDPDSFKVDDGTIEFSMSSRNGHVAPSGLMAHYAINRITGDLEATYKIDGLPDAKITGTCNKIDSIEKKF